MVWNIVPILGGEFGMVRDDIKYEGGDPRHSELVPSYIFLLESGIGKVLVDTSFGDPAECREKLGLVIKREQPLDRILARAGVNPADIKAVILTHLHWDHASNCNMFPNSGIYCQKSELDTALVSDSGYEPSFLEGIKGSMDRIVKLRGDAGIFDGIRAIHCGGHTVGSQMVEVRSESGTVVITGDTVMTYENVEQNIPVGLYTDREACWRALQFLRNRTGAIVLPSHDYLTMNYLKDKESCRI